MLKEDYELSRENIQDLSNKDALAAFFAKLGYNTNERLLQNAAAMGFGSEMLKSAITSIERLASEDGGLLEVYLVELKSVTVAVTRALAQAFRNLSVLHPLLVLTDDYQRLDFVLVERYTASSFQESTIPGLAVPLTRQVGVRPRILTIHRLKPGDVELRVLRRFSYTESDSLAQYDKLLSAYDVAEWSEPFFNSRALFSDYYLTQRLPESPEWKNPAEAAAMTRAYRTLRDLYVDVRETFANQPSTTVRTNLLVPTLQALGFSVEPTRADHLGAIEPDYRLSAMSHAGPFAFCLAYPWNRNLDGKDDQRDSETPDENPGAAVVSLLDRDEVDWAIVTNGKLWRLYSAKAHSRATNYYEIDLEETLAQPPEHRELAFRYFWYFFRAAAFLPTARMVDGETRQMCFLDSLVNESERYAHELGQRLKDRVFFEIFPHFARGFILHARRTGQLPAGLDTLPDEERSHLLAPFFSGTLTFLYRLLFLLYAESRDLLPVREIRGYNEKSLEKLKREIAAKSGPIEDQAPARIKAAYNELSTALYDRLQDLFRAVDGGDADLNVPVYNGALFITQPDPSDPSPEAEVARFLSTCKIPDRQLALGLDRMARDLDEKHQDLVLIDYKSLGVRQLGSIYEGLLEFKLRVASVEMAVIKGKKTEETIPYAEALQQKLPIIKEGRGKDMHDKTLPKGAVYLENDRRERKATGSYYTPDYIVKYIVEHTIGPVLQEKLEALRPIFREAEKTLRAEQEKARALRRDVIGSEHDTYKKFRTTLNDAFFDLKVLDPAMGSGHFLVEAVDYITDRLADFLTAFRWNPVVYELALTRREIQREMEQQGVTIDMSKLTDLNLLKRRILKSSIYGVDLNPMAVELAKVSLWLDCFTLGAPLSFLDHHMKCGNSLIGGSVREVQDALSSDLWGSQFTYLLDATQLMRKVGELSDVTAQEVAASRAAYKGAYDALAPFKRLLDVYISEYFGNKGAKLKTRLYAGAIVASNYNLSNPDDKKAIETALKLAETKRFFHWELEFPEVFFDESKRKELGGFDAVVGNPPYVRQEQNIFKDYFEANYKTYSGRADLYVYFLELEAKLSRLDGQVGAIVSNKFTEVDYGQVLRKFLMEVAPPQLVLNFADLPVFEDVTAYPMVLILKKAAFHHNQLVGFGKPQSLERFSEGLFIEWIPAESFEWKSPDTIIEKISTNSVSLTEYCSSPLVGIKTGANDAFIYSDQKNERTTNSDFLQPYLFGKNVGRYEIVEPIPRIVYPYKRVNKKYTPVNLADLGELSEYLRRNENILKARAIIRDKFPRGLCKWYEYQQVNHAIDYNVPKIVFPNISDKPSFAIDDRCLIDMTAFVIPTNDLYLLSLLNSQLIFYIISSIAVNRRGGYLEWKVQYVEHIPIRRINFTLSLEQRAYYLEKARNHYDYCLNKHDQNCVLDFVNHHLALEPEESDVVHDLLAMLAEEMMRLNKEKRAAQREFLDWLVVTLKILPDREGRKGIDVLTGKSKLMDYPGDYQKGELPLTTTDLLDILQKNRGRLGVSLSDTILVDRLHKVYEESLQKVLPLKEQLAKTDRLIDAVVYRLYGLTEEEIRVVEGRG